MGKHKSVAAVIPAYNEEERVAEVVKIAVSSPLVDETIVVDDGSKDATAKVASEAGARVFSCESNEGKGAALQRGLGLSCADILLFVDADLVGLTEDHIADLVLPLLTDHGLEMTVGRFQGGRIRTDLSQILVPSISGQRAVRRSFLDGIPDLASTRYACEVAITRHAKDNGNRVKEVLLTDLTHVMKEEKLGIVKGFWSRLGMYSDMLRYMLPTKGKNGDGSS